MAKVHYTDVIPRLTVGLLPTDRVDVTACKGTAFFNGEATAGKATESGVSGVIQHHLVAIAHRRKAIVAEQEFAKRLATLGDDW